MRDSFDRNVEYHDGSNKIFQNRVKYIVFILTVATGIVTLWDKCSPSHKAQAEIVIPKPIDSVSSQAKRRHRPTTASVSHKSHVPYTDPKLASDEANTRNTENANVASAQPIVEKLVPKVTTPLRTTYSDNIEFKLIKAVGSVSAQTITMTVNLTTDKGNWYILSYVQSIIDPDGNEYKLKSFTNGASTWNTRIDLVTGIPIKCTYTFGGVLPDVKTVKLFKYDYNHQFGSPFYVEFRDVPVDWK
jgi:hypothetical protein